LIVDEAHHLRNDVLEDLRLLTNYQMDSENRLCLLLARLRLFAPIFHVTHCLADTAGAKVGTTRRLVEAGLQGGGDPRWRLRGQLQT
jgi:hypothetical protein